VSAKTMPKLGVVLKLQPVVKSCQGLLIRPEMSTLRDLCRRNKNLFRGCSEPLSIGSDAFRTCTDDISTCADDFDNCSGHFGTRADDFGNCSGGISKRADDISICSDGISKRAGGISICSDDLYKCADGVATCSDRLYKCRDGFATCSDAPAEKQTGRRPNEHFIVFAAVRAIFAKDFKLTGRKGWPALEAFCNNPPIEESNSLTTIRILRFRKVIAALSGDQLP
jgi:hypothetical protein